MADIKFPFGDAETLVLSATGTQALEISDNVTIVDGVTTQATGNRTLDLTIDPETSIGALLFVKSKTAGTETTIPGANMSGPTITGVAGKTKCWSFVYDGVSFKQMALNVQLD